MFAFNWNKPIKSEHRIRLEFIAKVDCPFRNNKNFHRFERATANGEDWQSLRGFWAIDLSNRYVKKSGNG